MYGIVLARRDFRESDQIISILTAEEGKREYVARGVKKIVSKNTAHLEPCSLISFGIAQGKKEFSYLTNVQAVEGFFQIRTSLRKLHIVGYSLDALLTMMRDGEEDTELYHLFLSYIRFLNNAERVRLLLLDGFLIKVFTHFGYAPVIDACVVCEKSYKEIGSEFLLGTTPGLPDEDEARRAERSLGWYFAGGGIVCASCKADKQKIGERVLSCGLKEISTLDFLLRSDWNDVLGYTLDKDEYKKIHTLIYEFVLYHSEREWQDWGKMMG